MGVDGGRGVKWGVDSGWWGVDGGKGAYRGARVVSVGVDGSVWGPNVSGLGGSNLQ